MIQFFLFIRNQWKKILTFCFTLMGMLPLISVQAQTNDRIYLELKDGLVVIETFPEVAPLHVRQITELVEKGFYDGIVFHRVIEGFMAQTGDPTGTGMGGSGKNIRAEFSDISHERGIVSMARASDPNSADSQFFIVFKDSPFLDGQYTVWGRVVEGMEHVDAIRKGANDQNGMVKNPDKIIRMYTKP